MNLKKITNEDLVILKADYKSKQEALEALAEKLYESGKISDNFAYTT